jgi:hypothetical protein
VTAAKRPEPHRIQFNHDDDTHAERAREQKLALLLAARDIRAGRPPQNPRWIAAVLRKEATAIPVEQRGRARRFDHGGALMRYGWLRVHDGLDDGAAVRRVAAELGLAWQSVAEAMTDADRENVLQQFTRRENALRQLSGARRIGRPKAPPGQ